MAEYARRKEEGFTYVQIQIFVWLQFAHNVPLFLNEIIERNKLVYFLYDSQK